MRRSLVAIAMLCSSACAEEEAPTIIEGERGACGAVVEGAEPGQVECPAECPVAVQAFRVRDTGNCERSPAKYVACMGVSGGGGTPGAGVLQTPDGPIFVDSPSYDCTDADAGCVTVDIASRDRWEACSDDVDGCSCVCEGSECAYDRYLAEISGCGLPSPCDPLTGDAEPTTEQIQCYLDVLAQGGPIKIEVDVTSVHDITGQAVGARQVIAVAGSEAIRLDSVSFDAPSVRCDLKAAGFFLGCDPEDPTFLNQENEDGMLERVPCTDPITWMENCEPADPVCPGTGG